MLVKHEELLSSQEDMATLGVYPTLSMAQKMVRMLSSAFGTDRPQNLLHTVAKSYDTEVSFNANFYEISDGMMP